MKHPLLINSNGKIVRSLSQRVYFTKEQIRKAFDRGFNSFKDMKFNIVVKW
jgi:hypothetical protein